jgi:hypothetical protein
MPVKKGPSKKTTSSAAAQTGKTRAMARGGDVISTPKGVQGPAMVVKKRDGNRPVKIY